ncbi:hypothetical protein CEXT_128091 [Caerostris extrusa]|uniref:Uncharacterized protein n=1 Tax=Caerostris extrusa TaxID=172846 RepID=A0AAV4P1S8_CAEEX|nr:hypothetical protein CEXT_128091 [Caerostris extrusa]
MFGKVAKKQRDASRCKNREIFNADTTCVFDASRKPAVAPFRLSTDHDCLIRTDKAVILDFNPCDSLMKIELLDVCSALSDFSCTVEKYWKANKEQMLFPKSPLSNSAFAVSSASCCSGVVPTLDNAKQRVVSLKIPNNAN